MKKMDKLDENLISYDKTIKREASNASSITTFDNVKEKVVVYVKPKMFEKPTGLTKFD
jgi:hypothetical protein